MPNEVVESSPPPRLKTRPKNTHAFSTQLYPECTVVPPKKNLLTQLPEPCCEPPWEPSVSWPRFLLQRDLRLGVGLVNPFRSVKKRAPKLRSFSGPKNGRTRWAPIMGAHLVLPKMGPEFDPSLWATTLKKNKPASDFFLGRCPPKFPVGGSWSLD